MVIEPLDKEREAELRQRIASTASGVGEATARRVLRREDVRLARDMPELHPYVRSAQEILEPAYASGGGSCSRALRAAAFRSITAHIPNVTSHDTNVAGCLAEAGIPPARVRRTVMVVRSTQSASGDRQVRLPESFHGKRSTGAPAWPKRRCAIAS